tara:strand:- start:1815 stop:1985 length:171 start_codon:yes stop_codon:yes gene_type:complete
MFEPERIYFITNRTLQGRLFMQLGNEQKVKATGKMSLEDKEYIVQDGDICHFRFNV